MTAIEGLGAYRFVGRAPTLGGYVSSEAVSDGHQVLLWRSPTPLPERAGRRLADHLHALRRVAADALAMPEDGGVDAAGHGWLAVPLVGEEQPADRLLPRPLSPAEVAAAVRDVAAALGSLADAGIPTWGQIAPERLLIHRSGARLLPPLPPDLPGHESDPAYTAPEVLAGADPEPASDTYALAATVYALLAGAPPYGTGPDAVLRALTAEPDLRASLPGEVIEAIRGGLRRGPAVRPAAPAHARTLVAALTAGIDPAQVDTLPPAVPVPAREVPLGSGYLREAVAIGHGSTGRVYRCRRRDDTRPIAVKVLREEFASDPETVARFLRERTTLRAFEHPHLVRIHDLIAEGDTLAIVMDLVEGDDLRRRLRRGALPGDQALILLGQVCAALAVLHTGGVVHRDVKPENVLVESRLGQPWARLTDFGLARATDGPVVTRMSQLLGTPAYVAPEVALGRRPTVAVDVYAVGVMAYELLAGRRPFVGDNPLALVHAHVDTVPERPASLGDAAWRVVSACLDKDPTARPTAAVLAQGFPSLCNDLWAPARPGAAPMPAPPLQSSHLPLVGRSPSNVDTRDGVTGRPGGAPPEQVDSAVSKPGEMMTGTVQPTTGATRPLAEQSTPAPPRQRRRWWLLVSAVVACSAVGLTLGLVFRHHPKPGPTIPSSPTPATQQYFLLVGAASPKPGTVRLDFNDASNLPAFEGYVVYRDKTFIEQVPAGQAPPYMIFDLDRATRYCFRVAALVRSDQPVPSAPPAACLVAAGPSARPGQGQSPGR